jgi:hypothetical protein
MRAGNKYLFAGLNELDYSFKIVAQIYSSKEPV